MRLIFEKSVPPDMRTYLKRSLREFEAVTIMTDQERHELYQWVAGGNDVNSNPSNLAYENGSEMDFITGIRTDLELYEDHCATASIS